VAEAVNGPELPFIGRADAALQLSHCGRSCIVRYFGLTDERSAWSVRLRVLAHRASPERVDGRSYIPRQLVGLDIKLRKSDLRRKDGPKKTPLVVRSAWLGQ